MNTPNHPATLRESIAAEIEWHRAEETEWREEEKLCPGGERPQCRFAAMEHKTAADRLEARLASHPEDGRGEPALVWRAHGQDRWNFTNPYPLDKLGEPNRELYEFHWVHALPDVDKHEAGLLESEGGEGRGEEEDTEPYCPSCCQTVPSDVARHINDGYAELEKRAVTAEAELDQQKQINAFDIQVPIAEMRGKLEAEEARAIEAEEALGRVRQILNTKLNASSEITQYRYAVAEVRDSLPPYSGPSQNDGHTTPEIEDFHARNAEAVRAIREWAESEAGSGGSAYRKGRSDAGRLLLSLLPSNDPQPKETASTFSSDGAKEGIVKQGEDHEERVEPDHYGSEECPHCGVLWPGDEPCGHSEVWPVQIYVRRERSEGEGGGEGDTARDSAATCSGADTVQPSPQRVDDAASLTSCPTCKSHDPERCKAKGIHDHLFGNGADHRYCCPNPFHGAFNPPPHPAPNPEAVEGERS